MEEIKKETVWSHSRLNTILEDPMRYYLLYKQGITTKTEKPALAIGSAVHHGIEIGSEDLTDYFNENGNMRQVNNYSKEQLLAEAMVHGYLKHKDELFDEILKDDDGNKLELVEETHELNLTAELPSHKYPGFNHKFLGIIDLLLLTNKGFVLIDYKTSSSTPDFQKYLEQIYRYIFLLRSNFPDIPVYKIGIINIKKTQIRQKQNENSESYLHRMKQEYEINDDNYVNLHLYNVKELDENLIKNYIDNLSDMVDFAKTVEDNEMWFINFNNAVTVYGKSDYYDIYYETPGAYALYNIRDKVVDEFDETTILDKRECVPIDLLTMKKKNVMNKYSIFETNVNKIFIEDNSLIENKVEVFNRLKKTYITDDKLLNNYWEVYMKELDSQVSL